MNRFHTKFETSLFFAATALIAVLVLSACDQSAIFNSISNETEKAEALIEGSPSRIVKIGTDLFAANGHLWKREAGDGTGKWTKASTRPTDGGATPPIRDLATTDGSTLYALTVEDDDTLNNNVTTTKVWKSADGGASWAEIALDSSVSSYRIDSLYAAEGILFAGAHAADASKTYGIAYAVLKFSGTTLVAAASDLAGLDDGGMFVGAAYDGESYYLATTNLGIYAYDGTTATTMISTSGYLLTGIAAVGKTNPAATTTTKGVIAVGREEDTLVKPAGATAFTAKDHDFVFTGAIAEYAADSDGAADYVLLGIKYATTYGYREIALNDGILTTIEPSLSKPDDNGSVNDYDQYAGALGVVPVRRLYQSWEGEKSILYASTDLQGLWSSSDKGNWNLVDK